MNDYDELYDDTFHIKQALCGSFPHEPSLFEELGINLTTIYRESMLPIKVLNGVELCRVNDVYGPIILLFIFTLFLIIQGKLHFEYIYLVTIVSALQNYIFVNLLARDNKIDLVGCCGVLGYSFGPVAAFSIIDLIIRYMGRGIRICVGLTLGIWSTYSAVMVFCKELHIKNKMVVVGYPLLLAYTSFILMVLF